MIATIVGILFALAILSVLVWGGDRLLALLPGSERIKSAIRTIAIVLVALVLIFLLASVFGVRIPFFGMVPLDHHR